MQAETLQGWQVHRDQGGVTAAGGAAAAGGGQPDRPGRVSGPPGEGGQRLAQGVRIVAGQFGEDVGVGVVDSTAPGEVVVGAVLVTEPGRQVGE
jgi:hypothetical protein